MKVGKVELLKVIRSAMM